MTKKKNTKNTRESFYKKLATSKGFYITLCSVAAITGFTIYSSYLRNEMDSKISAFDQSTLQNALSDAEVEIINVDDGSPEADRAKPVEFNPETVVTSALSTNEPLREEFSMDFPLDGKIITPCSLDELVFCESMNDWRTHNGTDIAARIGDSVKAAETGVVSEVYQDDLLGVVVVLDHGNNISSLYGNLQSRDFIKVGTKVQKGDIIGGVGDSGVLEAKSGPHLHFEIKSNGEYMNPEEFVGK